MKQLAIITLFLISITPLAFSQKANISSPNKKITLGLYGHENKNSGSWFLKASYQNDSAISEVISEIDLGLMCGEIDFSNNLTFLNTSKARLINEQYNLLHGKQLACSNVANEIVVSFANNKNAKINLHIRAYNDGVAFRYEFPDKAGTYTVTDELTSYSIPDSTTRWLEKFDLSNEGLYHETNSDSIQQNWCYPALFKSSNNESWYLIHEADVDRNYCATKLSNLSKPSKYKVTLPYPHEGEGEALPNITLPWKSPWRIVIIGSLADIVESTLVTDVSAPTTLTNTDWIKPGLVSWNYWSDNHGTKDFKTVCEFADLAAEMNWPYTLLDWEWDAMSNGGNVEDAAKYILSKGVKPLIWYNSSMFKWITATPVDRMKTHKNRVEEFTKLKEMGFVGVKIDFFLSEKQYMIDYYLDILEDAAQFEMMVYFHGCLVPRGWSRTYPNLMTYEGVRGAEWYNNGPEFTISAPEHNTILPFTRNVVGSMDYTPVTFTNSQFPHITSYGHELALSVLFESGLQHMADRPEGYLELADTIKNFLKEVPCIWDNTKFISGYPGRDIVLARQKGDNWYIGGISCEQKKETSQQFKLDFLQEGIKYKLILIADGKHDKAFNIQNLIVDNSSIVDVKMLRRGGFVASIKPME